MKRKSFYFILMIEAILCVAFCLVNVSISNVFTGILAFPFEQIGSMLRFLSLANPVGNGIALTLYVLICLIPAGILLFIKYKCRLYPEDWLLPILSVTLFGTLYLMINPAKIGSLFPLFQDSDLTIAKSILGGTVYSVLFGYLLLHILRLSFHGGNEKLYRYLFILLNCLTLVLIWVIFGSNFKELLASFASLRSGNNVTGDAFGFFNEQPDLTVSYLFLVLKFIIVSLPYALNVGTIFLAQNLLSEMHADSYSESATKAAGKLSSWCAYTLGAVILSNMMFNILQLLFAGKIHMINSTLSIPLVSIIFSLCILLFARMISQNRQIKHDNDLFI